MQLRPTDLTWQEIDEDLIVLDLRASQYLKLNGTAATLWRALESGADENELVTRLTAEYDVDRDTATRDMRSFLKRLRNASLIIEEATT